MGRKHLVELLREEQEPFVLENFIDERRSQNQRPATSNGACMQLNRRQPVSSSAFCKSPSSFLHLRDSSDSRRSPLSPFRGSLDSKRSPFFDFPAKSPSSASRITAALLLEAALRIQRYHQEQQSTKKKKKKRKKKKSDKPRNGAKGLGFGLLFSVLKRLVLRKPQREIKDEPTRVSVKDILKWDSPVAGEKRWTPETTNSLEEMEVPDAFLRLRSFRVVLDEKNENGANAATQCISTSQPPEEMVVIRSREDSQGASFHREEGFHSSPSRFLVAHSSAQPSDDDRTGDFRSPAASPGRRRVERQLFGGTGVDEVAMCGGGGKCSEQPYCEEEKDQSSPVSVLDPPFEEEDDEEEDHHHHHHEEDELQLQEEPEVEEDDHDDADGEAPERHVHAFEQSFANVQRSTKQLLSKIRRFERLAGLNPVDLEKRIAAAVEDEEDDAGIGDNGRWNDGDDDDDESMEWSLDLPEKTTGQQWLPFDIIDDVYESVREDLGRSSANSQRGRKIPPDLIRLVLDLVEEERQVKETTVLDADATAARVRERFEEWREVESNTIDMMVDMDLRRDGDGWIKGSKDQVVEVAEGVELGISKLLVEELLSDLLCQTT